MSSQVPTSPVSPVEIEEINLSDYLNVLYRRRRSALTVFLLVVIGVTLFTFLVKPVYEATATVHVQDDNVQGIPGLQGSQGSSLLALLGMSQQDPVETEIEILRSRTNIEKVVNRLHLNWQVSDQSGGMLFKILEFKSTAETSPDEGPEYNITITGPETYSVKDDGGKILGQGTSGVLFHGPNLTLLLDQLQGSRGDNCVLTLAPFAKTVRKIRDDEIKVSEVGKDTNIIQVSYQDTDPVLARDVINTLVQVYLERNLDQKTLEAGKSVEFISKQLGEVRTELEHAEKNLEDYKSKSGVIQLDTEAQNLLQQVTDTEKERTSLSLRQHQVKFAIGALNDAMKRKEVYAPSVLTDDPVVGDIGTKLAELEVKKRGLLIDYTVDHPVVQAVQDQIIALENRLLATYQTAEQALNLQIGNLDRQLSVFSKQIRKLPTAEQDLARLTRVATVNADIYTFLLQNYETARIARASTISNLDIIDPAIAPDKPVKPKKAVNLLLGLVVGCMLGVGIAFFREYLDDTIKDVDSAKRLFGVPVLATIPFIGRDKKKGEATEGESPRVLITHLEPKSPPAEAFRALRTAIHFSAKDKKQVLMVTSTFPGEGKTTTSANLAETIAQTGSRVLLIGCDLRRPTLHTIFNTPKTPGLTELLVGDATLEQITLQTGINSLDFISAGTTPPNPAELLGSERMAELIEELRSGYDTIILDAPPMLAVTDASLLTAVSDLIILVLEAGGVRIKAAQHMAELLRSAQSPVAGIAFNDKSGKGAEYYTYYRDRYGRYGSQYGYGYYASIEDSETQKRTGFLGWIFKKKDR